MGPSSQMSLKVKGNHGTPHSSLDSITTFTEEIWLEATRFWELLEDDSWLGDLDNPNNGQERTQNSEDIKTMFFENAFKNEGQRNQGPEVLDSLDIVMDRVFKNDSKRLVETPQEPVTHQFDEESVMEDIKQYLRSITDFNEDISQSKLLQKLWGCSEISECQRRICSRISHSCLQPFAGFQKELASQVAHLISEGRGEPEVVSCVQEFASSLTNILADGQLQSEIDVLKERVIKGYENKLAVFYEAERIGADFAYTLTLGLFRHEFFQATCGQGFGTLEDIKKNYILICEQALDAFRYCYPPNSPFFETTLEKLRDAFHSEIEYYENKMQKMLVFSNRLEGMKGLPRTSSTTCILETNRDLRDATDKGIKGQEEVKASSPKTVSQRDVSNPKDTSTLPPPPPIKPRKTKPPLPIGIMIGRDNICITLNNKDGRFRNVLGPMSNVISFMEDGEIILGPSPNKGLPSRDFKFRDVFQQADVNKKYEIVRNSERKNLSSSEIYACTLGMLDTFVTKEFSTNNVSYTISHPSAVNSNWLSSMYAAAKAAGMEGTLIPESSGAVVSALYRRSINLKGDILVIIEEDEAHNGFEFALYRVTNGVVWVDSISGYRQSKGYLLNGPSGLDQGLQALKPRMFNPSVLFHCNPRNQQKLLKGLKRLSGSKTYFSEMEIAEGCAILAKYQANLEFRTVWENERKLPKLNDSLKGHSNISQSSIPHGVVNRIDPDDLQGSTKQMLRNHFLKLENLKKEIQEKYLQLTIPQLPDSSGRDLDNAVRSIQKEYISIQRVRDLWNQGCRHAGVPP